MEQFNQLFIGITDTGSLIFILITKENLVYKKEVSWSRCVYDTGRGKVKRRLNHFPTHQLT